MWIKSLKIQSMITPSFWEEDFLIFSFHFYGFILYIQ